MGEEKRDLFFIPGLSGARDLVAGAPWRTSSPPTCCTSNWTHRVLQSNTHSSVAVDNGCIPPPPLSVPMAKGGGDGG